MPDLDDGGTGGNQPVGTRVLGDVQPRAVGRRTVLQGAVVGAALATGCSAATGLKGPSRSAMRGSASLAAATPSSTPPPSAWRAFAAGLDGDLVRPGDADYFEAKELFNPRWDSYRPLAVVEATTPQDVSESIKFAQKYSLRIRPKAGGHSYVGASSATGVIVVSTARMSHVSYDAAAHTATVGAGARLYPVHSVLASHGRTIPTGTCPTVGAAGLTMGGGIGIASRSAGLTCDQLASAQIVTADGVIRSASAGTNPDLLWALRGGGGGNFGIVTRFVYHTQPTSSLGFFLQTWPWTSATKVIRGWASRMKQADHSTWANLHLTANSSGTAGVNTVGVCAPGHETAEAHALESAIGVDATSTQLFTKTYLAGIQFLGGGTTSQRQGWAAGSDVLSTITSGSAQALVRVIADRAHSHHAGVAILDPLTGAVRSHATDATAYPYRHHLCDIQWYLNMPDHPTVDQIHAAYNWIDTCHNAVSRWSSGGYVNYLEPRRHVASYYGTNFGRLTSVKRAHDPHNFFDTPWSIPT